MATLRDMPRGADLPPLLSVDQACELLGVSRSAGYRAAATGDLPTVRLLELLGLPWEKAG